MIDDGPGSQKETVENSAALRTRIEHLQNVLKKREEAVRSAAERNSALKRELEDVRSRYQSAREAVERKNAALATLKERLERNVKSLRDTREKNNLLAETVRKKNDAAETLKDRIAILTQSLHETREHFRAVRRDPRAAGVLGHNSSEGMDAFFADNPEDGSYAKFADAVDRILRGNGISLDGLTVFDAGVGPGYMLRHLLERHEPKRVSGMDFSPVGIGIARETIPSGHFHVGSLYDPIPGRYDFVLCTEVLEHLEEPGDALDNVLGAVAPGGCALLSTPDGRVDYSGLHVNFWSPESWTFFVRRHGAGLDCSFGQFSASETASYLNNFALVRRPLRTSDPEG